LILVNSDLIVICVVNNSYKYFGVKIDTKN